MKRSTSPSIEELKERLANPALPFLSLPPTSGAFFSMSRREQERRIREMKAAGFPHWLVRDLCRQRKSR